MVLGFIVGLESLDFFAEALLEGMNFFFERFYFVLIMNIVIVTPVTSRTVALSTTAATRVHASLLSELVCEVFHFTTQHHEVVLLLLH